jgi:toxin secretion/phage lysis holin
MMEAALHWFEAHPWTATAVIAMAADTVLGLAVAFAQQAVHSGIGRRGTARKVGVMVVIALAFGLERVTQMPLGELVAAFYFFAVELVSITEHAARLGLPMPPAMRDALAKVRGVSAPPTRIAVMVEPTGHQEES